VSLNQPLKDCEPTELGDAIPHGQQARRTGHYHCSEQEKCEQAADVTTMLAKMPPTMRNACQLLMHKSKTDVAEALGISRSALYEMIERIRHDYFDELSDNSRDDPVVIQYPAEAARKTRSPAMNTGVYRYTFTTSVQFADVKSSLLLAIMATKSLHGDAQVRLDAAYTTDCNRRICEIDASTPVGESLNRLFVGFIGREFSTDSFRVERITDRKCQTKGAAA
jgi:hypothetical protein